jgi:hypothetical protein
MCGERSWEPQWQLTDRRGGSQFTERPDMHFVELGE